MSVGSGRWMCKQIAFKNWLAERGICISSVEQQKLGNHSSSLKTRQMPLLKVNQTHLHTTPQFFAVWDIAGLRSSLPGPSLQGQLAAVTLTPPWPTPHLSWQPEGQAYEHQLLVSHLGGHHTLSENHEAVPKALRHGCRGVLCHVR